METNLVCYAWAIAKLIKDDDSLTEKGVEILRDCLLKGKSVREAADILMNIE